MKLTAPGIGETKQGRAGDSSAGSGDPLSGAAANSDWVGQAPGAERQRDDTHCLVVVMGGNGVIRSVVEAPREPKFSLPGQLQGARVEDIWPAAVASLVRDEARNAIRSRQVRTLRLRIAEWQIDYEFILIAQGPDSVTLVGRDITESESRISRLAQLALLDSVTGLPNREWLLGEAGGSIDKVRLRGGRAAVICLEIGQLDVVESASSAQTRDALMKALSERLQSSLRGANREEETDDERYSAIARTDFSRFAILLPNIETGDDAAAVTERLVGALEEPVSIEGRPLTVTVSAGIALYPQDGSSAEELLASAVIAVEDARSSPTNNQQFHSGTVRMRALDRQDLEFELRAALDSGEFALAYQPIFKGKGHEIVAAEALLRWPKPLFGARSISEVIAVAEYTGLILPIGEWVLAGACEQLVEWHRSGHSEMQIAVNMSAQEFARADLVAMVQRVTESVGVDASRIVIEITERLLFRDSLDDFKVCRSLKELGACISVDDYGTGVCSFDHLARSPVDSVKINPSIVARMATAGPSRAACAAVTAMAHALGLLVVAEGVETGEQATALVDIGCDYLQGFLLGRPTDASALSGQLQATGT